MIKNQSKLGRDVKFFFKDRCNLADCPVIPFVFICFIRNDKNQLSWSIHKVQPGKSGKSTRHDICQKLTLANFGHVIVIFYPKARNSIES